MRVQSALLCDTATIENGKLFCLGAGIATWWAPGFPSEATPMLAGIMEADRDLDLGEVKYALRVVQQSTGAVLLDGVLAVVIKGPDVAGVPWTAPFIAPLRIPVAEPTSVDITLADEAGVAARVPLAVLARPA